MKSAAAIAIGCAPALLALTAGVSKTAPDRGKLAYQKCYSCHSLTADQKLEGPPLGGIVGRRVASQAGFAYSPAIEAHGGAWTYEQLDRYLASPARTIPGNKMSFAGIRNPKSRANLLAWLGSRGAAPAPFPPPAPPAVAEAPAGEVAATTGS